MTCLGSQPGCGRSKIYLLLKVGSREFLGGLVVKGFTVVSYGTGSILDLATLRIKKIRLYLVYTSVSCELFWKVSSDTREAPTMGPGP